MPAIRALGEQAPQSPPDIKEFPVHNLTKPLGNSAAHGTEPRIATDRERRADAGDRRRSAWARPS